MKQLILGGARSGKSRYAERLCHQIAHEKNRNKIYVATASAGDLEMAQRIQHHQQQRSDDWEVVEEQFKLWKVLKSATKDDCILIDCLTLWLNNCLHKGNWMKQRERFLIRLQECEADVILVSNEVGSGIVPMGEISRQFVDEIGLLHQILADYCNTVTLVVAGLPMYLKHGSQKNL